MLCIGRKVGESIEMTGGITITVLKSRGEYVRIGIDAPKDVRIVRSELTTEDATQRSEDPARTTLGAETNV